MSKKIEKANITDKDGNDVFFGDRFIIETPNASKGGKRRIAKVIKDTSEENSFCHRNYDHSCNQAKKRY